jgi:hypothetical protein
MAWEKVNSQRVLFTPEGGIAISLINDTGATSIKGYIVKASTSIDEGAEYSPGGNPGPIGIVYNATPSGSYMWVVISGIAEVYYSGNVTRGTFARTSTVAEGLGAGIAVSEALPTPPFATDKHFQEIGHPIESRTGAGLAKTVLHFN